MADRPQSSRRQTSPQRPRSASGAQSQRPRSAQSAGQQRTRSSQPAGTQQQRQRRPQGASQQQRTRSASSQARPAQGRPAQPRSGQGRPAQGRPAQGRPNQQARSSQYSRAAYSARGTGAGNGGRGGRGGSPYGGSPKRKAPLPLIIGIVVAIIIIVALVMGVRSCVNKKAQPEDQQQTAAEQLEGTTPAPDGQIVMTLGGDEETIVLTGEEYIESGCHAVDATDGDITSSMIIESGDVDTTTPGDYTVTYTAVNSANQTATRTRTVHVMNDIDADSDGISVFMYHYVYADANPPEELNTNYISASMFEAELKYLTENDYYFPSFQELSAYIAGTHSLPKKSVVLTFDDGEHGFLDYGVPLLEQYKVPATSFIITCDPTSKEDIYTYASEYVSFQSHTFLLHNPGHSGLGHNGAIFDLTEDELVEDLTTAQSILGTTEALAYPYGDVSDVADAACKRAGILCAFTTEYGQVHVGDNPYRLSRIRIFGDGELSGFYNQCQSGD